MEQLTRVSIDVPPELARLLSEPLLQDDFARNAMLLYPFVRNLTISHGRAAEILGVRKLDLIAFYGKLGLPYLDMSEDELNAERAVFQRAKENHK